MKKIALLIPWSKPSTGEAGWQWQTPNERELSKDFETREEALKEPPKDYILLDDGWHRIQG